MSRTSNEVNDFIQAFSAMRKTVTDARHQRVMEQYYKMLADKANAKMGPTGAQQAFTNGYNGSLGGKTTGGEGGAPAGDGAFQKTLYNGLIERGVPHEVAVGALASGMGESGRGLNTGAYNPNDNGSPSGGALQWHKERLAGLQKFAQGQGKDWRDGETQGKYALLELDTSEKGALDALKRGQTAQDGVGIWTHKFERPEDADGQTQKRLAHINAARSTVGVQQPQMTQAQAADTPEPPSRPKAVQTEAAVGDSTGGTLASGAPASQTPEPPKRPQAISMNEGRSTATGEEKPQGEGGQANEPEPDSDADDEPDTAGEDEEVAAAADPDQGFARGGLVRKYAAGGLVDDDEPETDDNSSEEAIEARQAASASQAINTQGGMSEGRSAAAPTQQAGGWQPASLSDVVDSVGDWVKNLLGGGSRGAVANHSAEAHDFLSGKNAASPQDLANISQLVDPQNELEHGIRLTRGLQALYNYHLANGDINKAQSAAASLLNGARLSAARLGSQAVADLHQGNTDGAVQKLIAADNTIPNGHNVKAQKLQDGAYGVIQTDEAGHVTYQGRVTPEMILGAANGLANGSEFWKQMELAAGKKFTTPPAGPSQAYTSAMAGSGGGGGAPVAGVPSGAPSPTPQQAIDTQTETPSDTQGGNPAPASARPVLDTNAMAGMSPKEATSYRQAIQTKQGEYDAGEKTKHQKAIDDQRQQYRQQRLDAAANKPMSVGDRGKVGEVVSSHSDEMGASLPDVASKDSPGSMTKPQFEKLKPYLNNVAEHIVAHNEMFPREALQLAASLGSVNPNNPDQTSYKVVGGKGKTVTLQTMNGQELSISKQGLAALDRFRSERLKVLKTEADAQANSFSTKAGEAAGRMGSAIKNWADDAAHNPEGLGPTNFQFEPM